MTVVSDVNNNISDRSQIASQIKGLTKKFNKELLTRALITVAALVAGVALVVFLSSNFLTFGISMIVFSLFAFCYQYNQYSFLNGFYNRVAKLVDEQLGRQ